jgi:hypothetical protein
MSDPANAVFLSYASQDAETARRMCEMPGTSGLEVWFDADRRVRRCGGPAAAAFLSPL